MRIIFLFLVLSFYNNTLFAITSSKDNAMELFNWEYLKPTRENKKDGDLNDLEPKLNKRSVTLTREKNNLKVIFESISEEVEIYIYDEFGQLKYWGNINMDDYYLIDIDISNWKQGNYTIEFINLENHKLTGRFRL